MPNHLYRRAGSTHWHIDIKVKGRQRIRRSSGTADRKIAQALADRIEAAEWGRLIHGDPASLTFAEAVLMYVEDGKSDLYTAKLVRHFKNEKVANIGPGDIQAAARVIYPDASPATWNRQVIVPARAVINHAASKRLAAYIRVPRFKELRQLRPAPKADWLPAFVEKADPRIAALATFMRITGARIGQAIALTWGAVDMQVGTAIIPPAKGHPERSVRLTTTAVAMLARLHTEATSGDDRVFGYRYRWSVYKPWRAACEAAGIPYVPTHPAGRRAFATTMQRKGVDPKTAADLGGWKSVRLMLEIYADADTRPGLISEVFDTIESQPFPAKTRKGA